MKTPDPKRSIPLWRQRRARIVGAAVLALGIVTGTAYQLADHGNSGGPYALGPESALSPRIQRASVEVREAYRFALANRDVLSRIPCFCGCGAEGHTSNASCYIRAVRGDGSVEFDNMSLG